MPAFAGMTAVGLVLLSAPTFASELSPIRSITVNGIAERKVVPDDAHIRVNLNAQDKQMANAKAVHDKKIAKLLSIAKQFGIEEKKVRTESSNVQPVYHYENIPNQSNKRLFDGYRVQTNLDVTVGDTKKLGEVMQAITDAGFEQGANTEWGDLMSMYYTLSDPKKLQEEMLTEAITNAKVKAQKMAAAAGASVGDVYEIREAGTPSFQTIPMPMMAMAEAKMAFAGAPAAPPAGEQQVQSTVTITYALK